MGTVIGFKNFNFNTKTVIGALSVPSLIATFTPCHHLQSSDKLGSFHWEVRNTELKGPKGATVKHLLRWFGAILCVRIMSLANTVNCFGEGVLLCNV